MAALAILAGGGSERMGQDKALKPFLGHPLIQRVLERLVGLADEMIVAANQPEKYAFLGLPLVPDLIPGRGALGRPLFIALCRTFAVDGGCGLRYALCQPASF